MQQRINIFFIRCHRMLFFFSLSFSMCRFILSWPLLLLLFHRSLSILYIIRFLNMVCAGCWIWLFRRRRKKITIRKKKKEEITHRNSIVELSILCFENDVFFLFIIRIRIIVCICVWEFMSRLNQNADIEICSFTVAMNDVSFLKQ